MCNNDAANLNSHLHSLRSTEVRAAMPQPSNDHTPSTQAAPSLLCGFAVLPTIKCTSLRITGMKDVLYAKKLLDVLQSMNKLFLAVCKLSILVRELTWAC